MAETSCNSTDILTWLVLLILLHKLAWEANHCCQWKLILRHPALLTPFPEENEHNFDREQNLEHCCASGIMGNLETFKNSNSSAKWRAMNWVTGVQDTVWTLGVSSSCHVHNTSADHPNSSSVSSKGSFPWEVGVHPRLECVELLYVVPYTSSDRLCGLVVRVPGYRSRGPWFDSRRYQIFWEVVGL
jgi:hypothetical protein